MHQHHHDAAAPPAFRIGGLWISSPTAMIAAASAVAGLSVGVAATAGAARAMWPTTPRMLPSLPPDNILSTQNHQPSQSFSFITATQQQTIEYGHIIDAIKEKIEICRRAIKDPDNEITSERSQYIFDFGDFKSISSIDIDTTRLFLSRLSEGVHRLEDSKTNTDRYSALVEFFHGSTESLRNITNLWTSKSTSDAVSDRARDLSRIYSEAHSRLLQVITYFSSNLGQSCLAPQNS